MNNQKYNVEDKDVMELQYQISKSQVNRMQQPTQLVQRRSGNMQRGIYSVSRNLDSNFMG